MTGSGALMMSELVAGSAWICPPVDGWARLLLPKLPEAPVPRPALPVLVLSRLLLAGVGVLLLALEPLLAPGLLLPEDPGVPAIAEARAARKVMASLVASAFLR